MTNNRRTFLFDQRDYRIDDLLDAFYIEKQVEGRTAVTIAIYKEKLTKWNDWMKCRGIETIGEVEPMQLREFLHEYRAGHTQGGTHGYYRAMKAFFRFCWYEYDFEWTNPITKVKCSAGNDPPIQGVQPKDVDKLFKAAKEGKNPERDQAILAILMDTGIRRSSLAAIHIEDIDLLNSSIYIRHSKNGRGYTVYFGKRCRRLLKAYLATIQNKDAKAFLFTNCYGEPLNVDTYRQILARIADRAKVERYSAHDYRRYFALESYRNGADIYEVAEMLGQVGISVTARYLAVNEDDKKAVHAKTSPLDRK